MASLELDIHDFAEGFMKALEGKDEYTSGHSKRVSDTACQIARKMGLDDDECYFIHIAGHFHDIGKINVPDAILLKTGKLRTQEMEVMRLHSTYGFEILHACKGLEVLAQVVLHHHERYDGNGYPDGLTGATIPLESRIIAIADSFDAMTTFRSYRRPVGLEEALQEIERGKGTQFDPVVADYFIESVKN
jgi:putative nucleotidyltransferase with HDIG domain